tara:strand:+ start:811 stop:1290 length:480 start_codon:yes stop_codon:yes gene_type:complete
MFKICSTCEKELDNSNFNKDKSRKDGLFYRCRSCQNEYFRNYNKTYKPPEKSRLKRKEYKKNYDVSYSKTYKITEKSRLREREYGKRPEVAIKNKARMAISRGVAKGLLNRAPCETCGVVKSEAHHWSYKKEHWLDVKWLCGEHHREEHIRLKEAGIVL